MYSEILKIQTLIFQLKARVRVPIMLYQVCTVPERILFYCLEIMKRMERHMVRGPLHKHFDLERKSAKQAEARLSQSLQRLEYICLYHLKSLIREQRQLEKELQRLQQGTASGNDRQSRPASHHLAEARVVPPTG